MLDNINVHKSAISNSSNDTFKLNSIINLAWDYRVFNTDSALYYSNRAIDKARQMSLNNLLSKSYSIKSSILKIRNELDSAEYYQMLNISTNAKSDYYSVINGFAEIGEFHSNYGNVDVSFYYFNRSLILLDSVLLRKNLVSNLNAWDIFMKYLYDGDDLSDKKESDKSKLEELKERSGELNVYIAKLSETYKKIGFAYINFGNAYKAIEYFEKVLNLNNLESNRIHKYEYMIESYYGLGQAYLMVNNDYYSEKYLKRSIKYSRLRPDSLLLAKSYRELANLSLLSDNYKDYINYIDKSIRILKRVGAPRELILSKLLKINIELRNGTKELNVNHNELGLIEIDEYDIVANIIYYELKFDILKALGSQDSALRVQEKINLLYNERFQILVESNSDKFKRFNNNSDLVKDIEYQQTKINQLNLRNSLALAVIILMLLLVIIIIVFYIKQKKNKELLQVLNSELRLSNQSLTEVMERKQELLSLLAHDIKSPILLSHRTLDLIANNDIDEEAKRKYLDQINEAVGRVSTLVQNILVWITSSDGEIYGNFTDLNVKELIEDSLLNFNDKMNDKNLDIDLDMDNKDYHLDIVTFQLIINNVLSNAIKFSDIGSTLKINLMDDELRVTNIGTPLESTQINDLRTKKKLESKLGTAGEKGTGLGLTIIKNLSYFNKIEFKLESDGKSTTAIIQF